MALCKTCNGYAPDADLNANGDCKDCADTKAAFEANQAQAKEVAKAQENEGEGRDGVITGDAPKKDGVITGDAPVKPNLPPIKT